MSVFVIASWIQFLVTIIAFFGFFVGGLSVIYPEHSIELYQLIMQIFNWEVRPIHYEKEIRSTKIFGAVIVLFSVLILIVIFRPDWVDFMTYPGSGPVS